MRRQRNNTIIIWKHRKCIFDWWYPPLHINRLDTNNTTTATGISTSLNSFHHCNISNNNNNDNNVSKSYYSTSSLLLQQHDHNHNQKRNQFRVIVNNNNNNNNNKDKHNHNNTNQISSTFIRDGGISSSSISSISIDKIKSITTTIYTIPLGSLSKSYIREACQILHSMAHFKVIGTTKHNNISSNNNHNNNKEWNNGIQGEYAWKILKRIIMEINSEYYSRISTATATATATYIDYDCMDKVIIYHPNDHSNSNTKSSSSSSSSSSSLDQQLDSKVFHDAIKSMVKSNNSTLVHIADDILYQLEQYYINTKSNIVHPTERSYALLLDAIKDLDVINNNNHHHHIDVVSKMQQIMDRITIQQQNGNPQIFMNSHLYNSLLNALAKHCVDNVNAAGLIQKMMIDENAQLDHVSYSIAIKALLTRYKWLDIIDYSVEDITKNENENEKNNEKNNENLGSITTAKVIEKLLIEMQRRGLGNPNVKTMTPILQALSKEGNIHELSNLMEWMEEMYKTWGWEDIRPNNYHFNTVITALTRKSSDGKVRSGSGHLAVEILNKMKDLYHEGGNNNARPDLITYNAVLHAISKEENSQGTKKVKSDIGQRAEALLNKMEDGEEGEHISPDIFSYNAVLAAYMNSATADAATKTQNILNRMTENDVEPDLLSYTICINTLSKSKAKGSAQQAEDLLRLLEAEYANGCESLKPDVKCYNSGEYIHQ